MSQRHQKIDYSSILEGFQIKYFQNRPDSKAETRETYSKLKAVLYINYGRNLKVPENIYYNTNFLIYTLRSSQKQSSVFMFDRD